MVQGTLAYCLPRQISCSAPISSARRHWSTIVFCFVLCRKIAAAHFLRRAGSLSRTWPRAHRLTGSGWRATYLTGRRGLPKLRSSRETGADCATSNLELSNGGPGDQAGRAGLRESDPDMPGCPKLLFGKGGDNMRYLVLGAGAL